MNPAALDALDPAMQGMLVVGAAMFLVGAVFCLRRSRYAVRMIRGVLRHWRSHRAMYRLEIPEEGPPVGYESDRMIGIVLMTIGYLVMGTVLLFVVPGWGALAFAMGFVVVMAVALARAR